jgi:hypothetical protein
MRPGSTSVLIDCCGKEAHNEGVHFGNAFQTDLPRPCFYAKFRCPFGASDLRSRISPVLLSYCDQSWRSRSKSSEATTDSLESGMFTGSIPAGMVAGLRLSSFSPTVSGCLSTFLICSNPKIALNTGTVAREAGRTMYVTFYPLQVTGFMDKRLVSRVVHIVRDDIVPINISRPWKEKRTSSIKSDCDVLRQKGYPEASVGFQLNSRAR